MTGPAGLRYSLPVTAAIVVLLARLRCWLATLTATPASVGDTVGDS